MKLQRDERECPKCGAHRGFACHTTDTVLNCPQLEPVPEPEMPFIPLAHVFPFGVPFDDF